MQNRIPAKESSVTSLRQSYIKLRVCLEQLASTGNSNTYEVFKYPYIKPLNTSKYQLVDLSNVFIFVNASCYTPTSIVFISPNQQLYFKVGGVDFGHCAFETITDFGDKK